MAMRNLFITSCVVYFLTGCATAYDSPTAVGWSVDPACESPIDADLVALAAGGDLWSEMGIPFEPAGPDTTTHITLCYTAGPAVVLPDGSRYRGFTTCTGSECRTRINHLETVPATYPALIAHEVAHALGIDLHLPPGTPGIMTAEAIVCDGPCGWSDADLSLLETAGLL